MKTGLILSTITIWIFFSGLISLAIIYDGIYIQLCFDFALVVISMLTGYYIKRKNSKNES